MIESKIQRELAIALFNQTWGLIEKPDRTPVEDLLMIHKAHASLFHWLQVGTAVNEARGQWQVSRVYAVLNWPQPALVHGERSLQICLDNSIGDFDLVFGYESVARALSLSNRKEQAQKYLDLAQSAAEKVAKPGDRDHVIRELNSIKI